MRNLHISYHGTKILFGMLVLGIMSWISCQNSVPANVHQEVSTSNTAHIVVLGNVQDAGSPHIGCQKSCCASLFDTPPTDRMVVSLGIVDPPHQKAYLVEATPDISRQLHYLKKTAPYISKSTDGIFLTHAHIGHYVGLMMLGREALGSKGTPVYAMPKMVDYLTHNGPWSQLVQLNNITLRPIQDRSPVSLGGAIRVTPFIVPHRDEYSETVGYMIDGPNRTALFIPDIDKWEKWDRSIINLIQEVDYALLDATFYSGTEIDHRDISEIPHPSVEESLRTFAGLSDADKDKVYFIHLNHTNPLLRPDSEESQIVQRAGYHIARLGDILPL